MASNFHLLAFFTNSILAAHGDDDLVMTPILQSFLTSPSWVSFCFMPNLWWGYCCTLYPSLRSIWCSVLTLPAIFIPFVMKRFPYFFSNFFRTVLVLGDLTWACSPSCWTFCWSSCYEIPSILFYLSSHPFPFYSTFQFFLVIFNYIFWFVILISCFSKKIIVRFCLIFLTLPLGIFSLFSSTQHYDFLFSLPLIEMAQNVDITQFFVRPGTV